MPRSLWPKIGAGLAVLFVLSTGLGYAVGAQVRGGDSAPFDAGEPNAAGVSSGLPAASTAGPEPIRPAPTTGAAAPASTTEVPTPTPTTAEDPTPTTTTAPGPRRPDRQNPLRVVMAGDSVMAGLIPPVKAALEADGTTSVRFILTPSILRDPTVRFTWNQQLAEFDPDVIVMFVGTWEYGVVQGLAGPAVSDPSWAANYERTVLDPWIQLITSRGAHVIWLGNPIVANPNANQAFAVLNKAFSALPSRWPFVQFIDTNPAVNGPGPEYRDRLAMPDGTILRTRQIDGLHLCAGGAALLGRVVMQDLATGFNATIAPGWERGAWTNDKVYPPASCPP